MGDYYGIMGKTAPQDAGETDAQAAGSPVADAQPPSPAVDGCQIQLVCQCENCRFWKAGNVCRLRDIRLDCYGKCADFEC